MPQRPRRRRPRPSDDRAWTDYNEGFRKKVMPHLLSSSIFVALYSDGDGGEQEIKFATSLGLCLLHEKPILLVEMPGETIPARLRSLADEVVEADVTTAEGQDVFTAALQRMSQRHGLSFDLDPDPPATA